jgi:hypothetical protein
VGVDDHESELSSLGARVVGAIDLRGGCDLPLSQPEAQTGMAKILAEIG